MTYAIGVAAATVAWFVAAGVLFFNPFVDTRYRSEEAHPAVRTLPQEPKTLAMILAAVLVQCLLWGLIYLALKPALPAEPLMAAVCFGGLITVMKLVPRDIDRLLLTTYPPTRMTIEFVVGVVCAFVVGLAFAWTL